MDSLTFCRLRITIRLLDNAFLPPYKGSCIRGAIGHGMRALACTTGALSCSGCPAISVCDFTRLFKPDQIPGKSIPAPYIVDPPALRETRFAKGCELTFTLTLFGAAADLLHRWIKAIEIAGTRFGLGEDRAFFELVRIDAENPQGGMLTVYDAGTVRQEPPPRFSFSVVKDSYAASQAQKVYVRLLTPLKFKDKGSVANDLTAQLFFETLLRRIRSLSHFYATDAPLLDFTSDIKKVAMGHKTLRWITLERKSISHPTAVNLGGFVGSFELTGLTPPLLTLLAFGVYTHLGKNTVYGCGKYAFELKG